MRWRTLALYMLIIAAVTALILAMTDLAGVPYTLPAPPAAMIVLMPLLLGALMALVFQPWRNSADEDYKDGQS